jgi:hypothetical protein
LLFRKVRLVRKSQTCRTMEEVLARRILAVVANTIGEKSRTEDTEGTEGLVYCRVDSRDALKSALGCLCQLWRLTSD